MSWSAVLHCIGHSAAGRAPEDAAASSLRGAMSMRRRAADQQRARSIRRAVRRAVQQQRTAAARMAATLAGIVGGRSGRYISSARISICSHGQAAPGDVLLWMARRWFLGDESTDHSFAQAAALRRSSSPTCLQGIHKASRQGRW